jgi:7-alpha-hydroxysteroid dehydrogenase
VSGDALPLDQLVAIVTGAIRGIGAAIASAFAGAGADVGLIARGKPALDRMAARIHASGRRALVITHDVRDLPAFKSIVEQVVAEMGRLDLVVNNAGGANPRPFLETTTTQLEEAFRFNVSAAFQLARESTPYLLASESGAIINITSSIDRFSARGLLAYGTAKAALSHMTRLMAADLAPRVRVNAIAPGIVETDSVRDALTPEARAHVERVTPLRRPGTVEDIAAVAVWLASPAAGYVTGKVIEVDGGADVPGFPTDIPDL